LHCSLAILAIDTQLSSGEVLRAFHHDEPYLFLGSAFTTVGAVAIGFCVLRRRFDALLISMAIFAILYGQRLWLNADLLRLTVPNSEFFRRLQATVNLAMPIPAFIFFRIAGFFGHRHRTASALLWTPFLLLVGISLMAGPSPQLSLINNLLVVFALLYMVVRSHRTSSADHDLVVIRRGLLCFVALAFFDNTIVYLMPLPLNIEPFGFAIFLGCLGYVAARRSLERDVELGEIHRELELARRIQLSILPGAFPESADFRVAARYVPMTSVAGDLYEFLATGDRQAGLFIADVAGHGVPAALIASMVKMAATSQRVNAARPAQLLAGMNTALCGNTQGQFLTAAYVHLDSEKRELKYAAAGHPPMLLLRDGAVREIAENGLILAAFDFATYSDKTITLEPGDRLVLYTDGLIEARNKQEEFFGEESLKAALQNTARLTAAEAADKIISSVQDWATSQEDDLTVLVCDYLGGN
jgi:sigma-B regulation protein RsbU (phosphoserine phosphatase)